MTNDEAHEIFSKRVTQTRIDRELSQLDVADNLGISVSTYQNYERGRRDIPYDILIDLADVLGVSIDYLFGRRQGLGSAVAINALFCCLSYEVCGFYSLCSLAKSQKIIARW